jgi:thiol-disulfide isomerase/thioredoxin
MDQSNTSSKPMNKFASLLFTVLVTVLWTSTASAQKYEIKLTLSDVADTEIFLANYFGSKLYYADTAQVNNKGVATFTGNEPLKGGKYAFVTPGPKLFEVLIDDDQQFEMITDTADFIGHVKIKGSEANELYYKYIQFISAKKKEVGALNEQVAALGEDTLGTAALREQIIAVNEDVQAYQRAMAKDNPDNWGAQVVGMSIPIVIPDPPTDENGVITDSIFQYRYYINHFFDNVPLDNPWIARTPEFDKRFKEFFSTALVQRPDTVTKYADEFIKRVQYDDELYKYVVHHLTYSFETSKIMCMDAAFVHMIEDYYMKAKTPWMDSLNLANVTERALRMKPTLCGQKAPFMSLQDTTGTQTTTLYQIEADYTIVYIWDPDCGHCKKENPKMIELQEKFKDNSVVVYSVGYPVENELWIEYLREHPEMGNLINVSDSPQKQDNFRYYYDTTSTPVIILLDKDKKIIAKKVGAEQLEQILDSEMKKKQS